MRVLGCDGGHWQAIWRQLGGSNRGFWLYVRLNGRWVTNGHAGSQVSIWEALDLDQKSPYKVWLIRPLKYDSGTPNSRFAHATRGAVSF